MTSCKLKHYFVAHPIKVVTDRPLRVVLYSKDAIGRISQWAVELDKYHVEFVPRKAIKAQALTDFIAEWTDTSAQIEEGFNDYWIMYFDSSYALMGSGAGVFLILPTGETLKYAIQIEFKATNNVVEYEGLVSRLRIAKTLG